MSDKNIEKSFLYLILLSILFHVAAFGVFSLIPPDPERIPKDMTMVDLQDLPEPPPPVKPQPPEPKPQPEVKPKPLPRPTPVPLPKVAMLPPERTLPQARKEAAPKAENEHERIVQSKSIPNQPGKTESNPQAARSPGNADSVLGTPENGGKEAPRGEGLLKPHRGPQDELAKLFPNARNMAKMEEGFRKKYLDAEQGDTRLMDTDDPDIGAFNRRYMISLKERLNAIDRLHRTGIGRTVLNITFKRDGTIDGAKVLYSSGNKALEDLAIKASRTASYVGALPKKWTHEQLNMIIGFMVEEGIVSTSWE